MDITIGLALIAGFVSFISPCVLPLVPAYIGYMGGRMTHTLAADLRGRQSETSPSAQARLSTFVHSIFFVVGFSLVFVAIGLLSTAFIQQIGGSNIRLMTDLIGRVGGILIITFGLHFMGVLPSLLRHVRANLAMLDQGGVVLALGVIFTLLIFWAVNGHVDVWDSTLWSTAPLIPLASAVAVAAIWLWLVAQNAFVTPGAFLENLISKLEIALYSDTRRQMDTRRRGGLLDSFVMGVVFSAGWTPCIGPVYGTVLTMAANGGDVGQAGVLLGTYSLGLGIPFLLTALLLDSAQGGLRRIQRHMRLIELASGAFLVVIGLSVATGQLQSLSQQFAGQFAEFSIGVEEQVIDLFTGDSADDVNASQEIASSIVDNSEIGLNIGQFAPDFSTFTDTGESIALSELRGNIVLLNFWATWCGPCRIEMPAFQRAFEANADQGLVVFAVNNAETQEDVAGFRDELELSFLLGLDERAVVQRQYGILSYPSTFLIDREGRIIMRHFGAITAGQIEGMLAATGL